MTNWKEKYPIGSQWKTRGGWRAVVVDHRHGPVTWQAILDVSTYQHGDIADGTVTGEAEHDLIEPWKEPRTGEIEFNLYEGPNGKLYYEIDPGGLLDANTSQYEAQDFTPKGRKSVKWVEGEGMEDSE